MEKESIGKSILLAILFGIFGWIIGKLLLATGIFPIEKIPEIGLLLGVIFGAFKEYFLD